MYYQEDLVEDVMSRSDIVDIVGSYVRLQKRGGNYVGLCPFHNEKTPSFSVSGVKQMYYCFGCGVGGNVFTFLMEYENLSFAEALSQLADRAGIKLPEFEYSEEAKRTANHKAKLMELHKEAAKFYYVQLRSVQGEKAMGYLTGRGLAKETLQEFGLGYSGKYSGQLYAFLKGKGYDDGLLKQSGLIILDEAKGAFDRFWNRIMFPIMDVNNHVIAFGGRLMGEGSSTSPKYLNSPETKIFDKGRNLYGLNAARISRQSYFLICEGYMDVIALHQAGFKNAVASLGTAFTSLQANLISRYVKEVILTYDSDSAGEKAMLRAIPILKEAGIFVRVLDMQPYKDPDEFIKELGPEEYRKRMESSINSFYFEINCLSKAFDLGDPEQKTKFFKEVALKLTDFREDLERSNYIEAVANRYNIRSEELRKLVNKTGARQLVVRAEDEKKERGKQERQDLKRKKEEGYLQSQKLLLTWLAEEEKAFLKVQGIIGPEDFELGIYRQAAKMIYDQYALEGKVAPARILNHFEEKEEQTQVAELFHTILQEDMSEAEKRKAFADTVCRVKKDSLELQSRRAIEENDINSLQQIILEQSNLHKLHISLNTSE